MTAGPLLHTFLMSPSTLVGRPVGTAPFGRAELCLLTWPVRGCNWRPTGHIQALLDWKSLHPFLGDRQRGKTLLWPPFKYQTKFWRLQVTENWQQRVQSQLSSNLWLDRGLPHTHTQHGWSGAVLVWDWTLLTLTSVCFASVKWLWWWWVY
jgi:hypothetical protein